MGYWGYVDGQYGWIEDGSQGTSTGGGQPGWTPPASSGGGGGNSIGDAALAYAQQRAGYQPGRIMQEGQVTYQDGVPGIYIKYGTPQGSSTEWTPIPGWSGGDNVPYAEWGNSGVTSAGHQASLGGSAGYGGYGGPENPIFGSPYYQQVAAAVAAAAAADAAGRKSGVQQALISFGEAPSGFADKYGDIDALTRELADKNTTSGISTKARLLQGRADAIKLFNRAQTARGLRRSGNRGWGLRKRQLEHDQGYSDAVGKLLGYTGSLYSTFANNEYNRALQMANAALTASQMMSFGGGGGGGGGGGPASNSFTPAWVNTWAQGIDTGGYVPNSYDYGDPNDNSVRPNVLTNVDPMQGTEYQNNSGKGLNYY